jgi:hypothetical protein
MNLAARNKTVLLAEIQERRSRVVPDDERSQRKRQRHPLYFIESEQMQTSLRGLFREKGREEQQQFRV